MKKLTIKILDLKCSACETGINSHFKKLGIKASTSFANEETILEYDETKWSEQDLLNNIKILGYKPYLETVYVKTKQDYIDTAHVIISIIITSMFILKMLNHLLPFDIWYPKIISNPTAQFVFATFIQFSIGKSFFKTALGQVKSKNFGMDSLIIFSTGLAYVYSVFVYLQYRNNLPENTMLFFDVSATVLTLVLIGKNIEKVLKRKSLQNLKKLVSRQDSNVTLENGNVKDVKDLVIGDIFLVSSGQKIPADCQVIEGSTLIDESTLTGESKLLEKILGDTLISGSINAANPIKVKVLKDAKDSTLATITNSIENLQKTKPKIMKVADKIASYFVPFVFVIFIITLFSWMIFAKLPFPKAMYYSIAVAAVACPCAIGLAAPMAILNGASIAIKEGILFNNARVFEKFKDIDIVAFDKTGTLTEGELFIEKIEGDSTYLAEFISLEIISLHPIAKAFMNYRDVKGIELKDIKKYKELVGSGVEGVSSNVKFNIGSFSYISSIANVSNKLKEKYQNLLAQGYVVVLGAANGNAITVFGLKDKIKDSSLQAIEDLHKLGIKTVMITGDNQKTADHIAKQLSIDKVYAKVKPLEKNKIVKKLQSKGLSVAFVGDGVNDAAALTSANLSISMGTGSDIAQNVSDVTLLKSDLASIVKIIKISNKTLNVIKQNLGFAFGWNTIMIPIAALGFLSPVVGAFAMSIESLLVLANSYKIRFTNFNKS